MIIKEAAGDLFNVPQGYYLAHCISGDYALGAGIAKQFDIIYNMRHKLHMDFPIIEKDYSAYVGKALQEANVFNLVTKERYFHKPTYETLRSSLEDMKSDCLFLHIDKIAMPKIGCGLDRLEWDKVRAIIEEVFSDTSIEILVCLGDQDEL